MNKVILRLKSGREFVFECESYSLKTSNLDGSLCEFSYKGGVGECPIWFNPDDVEAIATVVAREGGRTNDRLEQYIFRTKRVGMPSMWTN